MSTRKEAGECANNGEDVEIVLGPGDAYETTRAMMIASQNSMYAESQRAEPHMM